MNDETRRRGNAAPDPETMAKQQRCADLAVQGLTYSQIAEHEGYASESGARAAVAAVFRRAAVESAEFLRPKYEARAELLWRHGIAVMAAGRKEGDMDKFGRGATVADRALTRLMRLHGLDTPPAPTPGEDGADLEQLKHQFTKLLGTPHSVGAEVIDAEIVDTATGDEQRA